MMLGRREIHPVLSAAIAVIFSFGLTSLGMSLIIGPAPHDWYLRRIVMALLYMLLMGGPVVLLARITGKGMVDTLRLRGVPAVAIPAVLFGVMGLVPLLTGYLAIQHYYLLPTWLAEELLRLHGPVTEKLRQLLSSSTGGGLAVALLVGAVAPGIGEELLFRGMVQRSLERVTTSWKAIALTALLFGAVHLQPMMLVPLTCLGLYFGYAARVTGSIIPSMIAHMAYNGVSIVMVSRLAGFDPGRPAELPSPDPVPLLLLMGMGLTMTAWSCLWLRNIGRRPAADDIMNTDRNKHIDE